VLFLKTIRVIKKTAEEVDLNCVEILEGLKQLVNVMTDYGNAGFLASHSLMYINIYSKYTNTKLYFQPIFAMFY